jgi:NAD(P)-dependent dehydrogenase (short-subunit alcohol dehydrogenase family)
VRLSGKVALITGASRGLGAAVARRFAQEGAHVVLIARSVGDLEAVDDSIRARGGAATLVPLDLLDAQGIDRLAAPLRERFGHLDILVGNAAILGRLTPLAHYPPDLWREVFAVNVDANWRLIRTLDPLLRVAPAGRAVFVTSGITRRVAPYWGAYAASKAALETLATTYAAEAAQSNLRVNLLNPGPTRTQLRAAAFPGEDPASLPPPEALTEAFVALAEPACVLHGQLVSARHWGAQSSPPAAALNAWSAP